MATYFMGCKEGKSKKDGSQYYRAFILGLNEWGDWHVFMSYVKPDLFQFCTGLKVGQAVIPSVAFGTGDLIGLTVDNNTPPIKVIC